MTISPSAIASLVSQTARLAPDYLDLTSGGGGAKVEREQACYLPVGSGDPVLGRIDQGTEGSGKGIYVASGHSCWGIVRLTASLSLTHTPLCSMNVNLTPFPLSRLSRLASRLTVQW